MTTNNCIDNWNPKTKIFLAKKTRILTIYDNFFLQTSLHVQFGSEHGDLLLLHMSLFYKNTKDDPWQVHSKMS